MLRGQTALVSGASRGIGRAIALKLAAAGANLALVYANNSSQAEETAQAIAALGVQARRYACDVADFSQVKTVVAQVKADFGSLEILVNNAGIIKDQPLALMSEESFDRVLAVNLKGAFNLCRQAAPLMMRQRRGRIINITSIAGIIGNAGQANYAAAKAGLIGLTKTLARELAPRGICCNAIAPGFILTDMTSHLPEDLPLLQQIPLGRPGLPEEVAELALFLAGDKAAYITGEVIRVDGGLAM